jgi:hypothetical protein
MEKYMINATIVQALVRHLLTALAGGMAVKYGVDGGTMDAIVAGFSALAGVGWSVYDKHQ